MIIFVISKNYVTILNLKAMKRNVFLLMIALVYLSACTNVKQSKEYKALQSKNDSLETLVKRQNQDIEIFISDFKDIQSGLAQIKAKELWISENVENENTENKTVKNKIKDDIQFIYSLLKENIAKVKQLNKKLNTANSNNQALKNSIADLQTQIKNEAAYVVQLNQKLKKMDIEVVSLNKELKEVNMLLTEKEEIIKQQAEVNNTAYYVVGTSAELKENKVINKQGGFIGIGRQSKVDADFNKDCFTQVDILKFKQVPVFAKKIKLLTTHPQASYKLVKGKSKVDSLVILNEKAFWSTSKYLVIEAKK